MDGQFLTIVLRLLHILAGVCWVGGVVLVAAFLAPTFRELPDGGRFAQHIVVRRKLPVYMNIMAATTVLSGLILYGKFASSIDGWAGSRFGITLGFGALSAV